MFCVVGNDAYTLWSKARPKLRLLERGAIPLGPQEGPGGSAALPLGRIPEGAAACYTCAMSNRRPRNRTKPRVSTRALAAALGSMGKKPPAPSETTRRWQAV